MGQVSIEDNVETKVFGRDVNRAARLGVLADGEQMLLTYSVFDSARIMVKLILVIY
jgi:class 3 adenylate cyclase